MTVMFHDIHHEDKTATEKQRLAGTTSDEVLYADDTICVAQTNAAMNRMLRAIEEEGRRYGLRLNKKKCEYLKFGTAGPVKFADGAKLYPVGEVKYLGCLLNERGDPEKEVKKRIIETTIILKRLDIYLRRGYASTKEKLNISNAVLRAKLMYGLESVVMTPSVLNRLDAFQLKGLRKMLGKKTTHYNRNFTNEYLFRIANEQLRGQGGQPMTKLSEFHMERRLILLAKQIVLRETEPTAGMTFSNENLAGHDITGQRRWGRPRLDWLKVTLADFWQRAKETFAEAQHIVDLDTEQKEHMEIIHKLADEYNNKYNFLLDELRGDSQEDRNMEDIDQDEWGPYGEEAPVTPPGFGPFGNQLPETPPRHYGLTPGSCHGAPPGPWEQ